MVACDNEHCPIEWFHYACVGIQDPPKARFIYIFIHKGLFYWFQFIKSITIISFIYLVTMS